MVEGRFYLVPGLRLLLYGEDGVLSSSNREEVVETLFRGRKNSIYHESEKELGHVPEVDT